MNIKDASLLDVVSRYNSSLSCIKPSIAKTHPISIFCFNNIDDNDDDDDFVGFRSLRDLG